jgi:hypothetical protein
MNAKNLLTKSALIDALLASASVAKANFSQAISGGMGNRWTLMQSVSDTVTTVFLLGGTLTILIGIRAKFGDKHR